MLGAIRGGMTTHAAAAAAHQEHAAAGALRCRQIRPRRIAILGSNGGVGTTTTAVLLASILAAARADQTLVLTMHSDASDVAVRLSVPHAPSVTEVMAAMRRRGQIPPTPVTSTGLRVLAAAPPGSAAPESGLGALLDVAASGHASVVVDAGVASRIGDLATVAELFDTVVLVGRTTADSIAATKAALARWHSQLPPDSTTRLILVPVGTPALPRTAGEDPVGRLLPDRPTTHVLPHDPDLVRGGPIELSLISGPSLTALVLLGADIMGHR